MDHGFSHYSSGGGGCLSRLSRGESVWPSCSLPFHSKNLTPATLRNVPAAPFTRVMQRLPKQTHKPGGAWTQLQRPTQTRATPPPHLYKQADPLMGIVGGEGELGASGTSPWRTIHQCQSGATLPLTHSWWPSHRHTRYFVRGEDGTGSSLFWLRQPQTVLWSKGTWLLLNSASSLNINASWPCCQL